MLPNRLWGERGTRSQRRLLRLVGAGSAILGAQLASADEGAFRLSAGAEFTTGKYGSDRWIDEWYIPLELDYVAQAFTVFVTVPYVSYTVQESSIGGAGKDGASGLGDILLAISRYDVFHTEASGIAIDLTGEVKIGSGDFDKGLGTGENDYTVESAFYRPGSFGSFWGGFGYVFRGEPEAYHLRDTWYGVVDWGVALGAGAYGAGIAYTWERSPFRGIDPISEVTLYLTEADDRASRGTLYLIHGLSESSPEWGIGYTMSYDLPRPRQRIRESPTP